MWLGEEITEKGVGNGISLLIVIGIVSRGPQMIQSMKAMVEQSGGVTIQSAATIIAIVVIAVLAIGAVVLMNEAERRIPVQE